MVEASEGSEAATNKNCITDLLVLKMGRKCKEQRFSEQIVAAEHFDVCQKY